MLQFEHYINMVYEFLHKQQNTILHQDGVHFFPVSGSLSIRQRYNLEVATISEGDAFLCGRYQNLCTSSLLVQCKMRSLMDFQNKNENDLPSLPIMLKSFKPIAIVSEGDLLLYKQSAMYGSSIELFATMHMNIMTCYCSKCKSKGVDVRIATHICKSNKIHCRHLPVRFPREICFRMQRQSPTD